MFFNNNVYLKLDNTANSNFYLNLANPQVYFVYFKKPSEANNNTVIGFFEYTMYESNTCYVGRINLIKDTNQGNTGKVKVTYVYVNPSIIDKEETISGKKTFTTLPETTITPTTNNQLTNKAYVDGLVGNINTVLATLTTPSGNGGN